jgi:hypothetical protein
MKITGRVWLALSRDERMVCLEFASWENAKRMKKAAKG